MQVSAALLDLISCPITGNKLVYDKEKNLLLNKKDGLAYPVIDGVPFLLKSEAIKI